MMTGEEADTEEEEDAQDLGQGHLIAAVDVEGPIRQIVILNLYHPHRPRRLRRLRRPRRPRLHHMILAKIVVILFLKRFELISKCNVNDIAQRDLPDLVVK